MSSYEVVASFVFQHEIRYDVVVSIDSIFVVVYVATVRALFMKDEILNVYK